MSKPADYYSEFVYGLDDDEQIDPDWLREQEEIAEQRAKCAREGSVICVCCGGDGEDANLVRCGCCDGAGELTPAQAEEHRKHAA